MQIIVTSATNEIGVLSAAIRSDLGRDDIQLEGKSDHIEVLNGDNSELSGADQTTVLAISYVSAYS